MPMVTRSNCAALVAISVVTLSRTWFSGSTRRLRVMPGWDDSKSPLSCSSVFICGLPTIATVTVPVACWPPAGLPAAAGGAPVAGVAAAGLAAAGALVAGASPAGAHAATSRLRIAAREAADDHQRFGHGEAGRTACM